MSTSHYYHMPNLRDGETLTSTAFLGTLNVVKTHWQGMISSRFRITESLVAVITMLDDTANGVIQLIHKTCVGNNVLNTVVV